MLDYLAIGIHELANISERRLERLINPGNANRLLTYNALLSGNLQCEYMQTCDVLLLMSKSEVCETELFVDIATSQKDES